MQKYCESSYLADKTMQVTHQSVLLIEKGPYPLAGACNFYERNCAVYK